MAPSSGSTPTRLRVLQERWSAAAAAERANAQLYITELCDALGAERPRPAGSDYGFEFPVKVINRDGTQTTNFVDLYKAGHFVLEAKDQQAGKPADVLMRKAFGQARIYTAAVEGAPPPYLLVLDVGKTLLVWDRWSGTYGGYNAGRRIDLTQLADHPDDVDLLRDIWEEPAARDPRARAASVTKQIAEKLARLASELERRGHDPETVARFLIRCVFTAFAEDVGLLPDRPFETAIREVGYEDPDDFGAALSELWRAMDKGTRFGLKKLLRFNGHFFKDQGVVPLTREDLVILHEAARADWSQVEPSIFGTLLVRALDPIERHRLGAEYTPREFIERLVRPTVEEPIRERWTGVQAEVLQLLDPGEKSDRRKREDQRTARERLREFHAWLRGLRFLDPACGSGNFLYVTLNTVKRIELEVLRMIEEVTGHPELAVEEVGPWQFYGLEIKPWARELAELVLWIGYHQFWRQTHGHVLPPEPVLRDTDTLRWQDSVLAWEEIVEVPEKSRPDPTPRIKHPVTGQMVPDPKARLPYQKYRGARQAKWPRADFIVGNPPYLGNKRMREAFGDGYVDALRAAYPHVPESADLVMYWWDRAAREVADGRTTRAGLITTNSIAQTFNRAVVQRAIDNSAGIVWAVADHPWVDETGSAAVRVAMTVIAKDSESAVRVEVDQRAEVIREVQTDRLNADLSSHADVSAAAKQGLRANRGLSLRGFNLVGRGFVLDSEEAKRLRLADPPNAELVRPYLNGKDLTSRPRGVYVIDFALRPEQEAAKWPMLYDIIRSRVKPDRDANKRESRRRNWWLFGEPNPKLRAALDGLPRYLATAYVAKHHFFTFLDAVYAPDEKLVIVTSADAFHLGALSSRIHETWALAAGARLEDRPTYNNSLTFDPFPFPDPSPDLRRSIADVAEKIDDHRKAALARDEGVTMTGMYNVVEKLRSGEALTVKEREIHEIAACGVLRDLHETLDARVAAAYGWPWPLEHEEILERLVALHDDRVEEEARGHVRWLRPDYQIRNFGQDSEAEAPRFDIPSAVEERAVEDAEPWPSAPWEQILAVQTVVSRRAATVQEVASRFKGARRDFVARHLDTLVMMGEARVGPDGAYHIIREAV